jgi:hypothetical protein
VQAEGEASMTKDEAVGILKKQGNPSLHDYAAAGSWLGSYYNHEGRHLLRDVSHWATGATTTTDSVRAADSKLDAAIAALERLAARKDQTMTRDQAGIFGAQQASQRPAGARRIMRLDGHASAYVITTTADGETWLCYSGKADGVGDPGRINKGGGFTADQRRAIANDQQWSQRKLAGINQANAAFWSGKGGSAA